MVFTVEVTVSYTTSKKALVSVSSNGVHKARGIAEHIAVNEPEKLEWKDAGNSSKAISSKMIESEPVDKVRAPKE